MDTLGTLNPNQLIAGKYTDPIFGTTEASFATQFLVYEYPNIYTTNHPDSIVLTIPYSQDTIPYYGNTSISQEIKIYKLTTALSGDTSYTSNYDPNSLHENELMGSKIFIPNYEDSILKITLNPSYADTFLYADAQVYYTDENFTSFFKGIYVSSSPIAEPGALLKFGINTDFLITIYYHNDENPDSLFQMSITPNAAPYKFNMFKHDYSSATFSSNINDTISVQDSVAYIQGAGGLRAKIQLPFIENINNLGKIHIYKAQLIVKTAPDNLTDESNFPSSLNLLIAGINPDHEYSLLEEYFSSYSYNSVSNNEGEFRFDIAGYLRDIIDNKRKNYGFYIYNYGGKSDFTRTVITTGKNSNPMKLVLTYTKI
jgi:hypothetical protein